MIINFSSKTEKLGTSKITCLHPQFEAVGIYSASSSSRKSLDSLCMPCYDREESSDHCPRQMAFGEHHPTHVEGLTRCRVNFDIVLIPQLTYGVNEADFSLIFEDKVEGIPGQCSGS